MPNLGLIVLTNAALASVLGLVVLAATMRWRAPRLVHLLWVLVLARLLAPPIMELGLLPPIGRFGGDLATGSAPTEVQPAASFGASTRPSPSVRSGLEPLASAAGRESATADRWRSAASPWLMAWLLGGLFVVGVYVARSLRFRRLLRASRAADPRLVRRVERLADGIGLSRSVEVSLIDEVLSPLVWPSRTGPVIVLPCRLVGRLSGAELDTVITHELAHIRRRDHLVRRVELVASILYWWHPIVWWARRSLRDAEEACCDQVVLEALPGSAHSYAEGILKTLELARGDQRLPALASGMSRFTRMQERLTMIMNQNGTSRPSRPQRWLPITAAISALVVFPTFAERTPQSHEELEKLQREEALAIERQAIDLDARQLELAERQLRSQRGLQVDEVRLELEHLARRAEELARTGHEDEARAVRAEMERMETRLDHELAQVRLESDRLARQERAALELRRAALEVQALQMDGRHDEAELLRAEAVAREMALEQDRVESWAEQMRLQERIASERLQAMVEERARLQAAGEQAQAEQMAHEIARAELRMQQMAMEQNLQRQQAEMELQHRQLQRQLENEVEARQAAMKAEQRELEEQMRSLNDSLLELNRRVEGENVRLELLNRIRDLRTMVEYLGDDGEMIAMLDRLEALAVSRLEEGES